MKDCWGGALGAGQTTVLSHPTRTGSTHSIGAATGTISAERARQWPRCQLPLVVPALFPPPSDRAGAGATGPATGGPAARRCGNYRRRGVLTSGLISGVGNLGHAWISCLEGWILWVHHVRPPMVRTTSCPRPGSMTQGLRRGPVIKEGLRFWIRRDVLSHGPALGSEAVMQRVQLARIAAYLHPISAATLPAAHGKRSFEPLSGLFGRGHGGRGVLSSDVGLPDGSKPQTRSDPARTIRQRMKRQGGCTGVVLGPAQAPWLP